MQHGITQLRDTWFGTVYAKHTLVLTCRAVLHRSVMRAREGFCFTFICIHSTYHGHKSWKCLHSRKEVLNKVSLDIYWYTYHNITNISIDKLTRNIWTHSVIRVVPRATVIQGRHGRVLTCPCPRLWPLATCWAASTPAWPSRPSDSTWNRECLFNL